MSEKAKRRKERQAKKDEKKARTLRENFVSEKRPRFLSAPEDRAKQYPHWKFFRCDWDHSEWGWHSISTTKWLEIVRKLANYETMSWGEIEGPNSHTVSVADCPNFDTMRRLEELLLDDVDTLFSLRITGTERIFGIFDGDALLLLWYDPNHLVWPSQKKNT